MVFFINFLANILVVSEADGLPQASGDRLLWLQKRLIKIFWSKFRIHLHFCGNVRLTFSLSFYLSLGITGQAGGHRNYPRIDFDVEAGFFIGRN